ncbi:MAG: flavodoxin family protein [Clostridia bacterium]|nr:flavodoxin family protein [Clostridia bacterium]
MKITVLNGSPRINGNTSAMVESFKQGATSVGHEVEVVSVGTMKISGCIACEYCHTKGNGQCAIKDDMQKVYNALDNAEMVVIASPVYYWSFSGQMQSTITRFYATGKPKKAKKYALILSSGSDGVYKAITSQYTDILDYFGVENAGIITAYGSQNKTKEKLEEAYNFGKNL